MSQELTHYGGTPGLPSRHFEGIGRADRKVAEYFQYFYLASRTAISMGGLTGIKPAPIYIYTAEEGIHKYPSLTVPKYPFQSTKIGNNILFPLYRIAGYGANHSLYLIPYSCTLLAIYTFYTSYIPFPLAVPPIPAIPYSYPTPIPLAIPLFPIPAIL